MKIVFVSIALNIHQIGVTDNKSFYALCSSAYAARDFCLMQSFKEKCYKWGYFTLIPDIDVGEVQKAKRKTLTIKKCGYQDVLVGGR